MNESEMVTGWHSPIANRSRFALARDVRTSACLNVILDNSQTAVNIATAGRAPELMNREVSIVLDQSARAETCIHIELSEQRSSGHAHHVQNAAYGFEYDLRRVLSLYASVQSRRNEETCCPT
jgi:hypothetical protein